MSDLTEHMVERMRVEIAQSAAADLKAALERLPEGTLRSEATRKVEDVRQMIASTASGRRATSEDAWWIVSVQAKSAVIHVVVRSVPTALEARDRAIDALVARGRIKDGLSVITDTGALAPGQPIDLPNDETVIYL